MARIADSEYQAMAELRYRLRVFLRAGDAAARSLGLEPQQYLLLLAIRGLPDGSAARIRTLAESLLIKHHSAVELVDRLERQGLVRRSRGRDDRREVLVSLLPKGQRVLERIVVKRISEVRAGGRQLMSIIDTILRNKPKR